MTRLKGRPRQEGDMTTERKPLLPATVRLKRCTFCGHKHWEHSPFEVCFGAFKQEEANLSAEPPLERAQGPCTCKKFVE